MERTDGIAHVGISLFVSYKMAAGFLKKGAGPPMLCSVQGRNLEILSDRRGIPAHPVRSVGLEILQGLPGDLCGCNLTGMYVLYIRDSLVRLFVAQPVVC